MQRRTITIPDDLGEAVDRLVANGTVASVSRFFQDAGRQYLAMAAGSGTATGGRGATPWRRLAPDASAAQETVRD